MQQGGPHAPWGTASSLGGADLPHTADAAEADAPPPSAGEQAFSAFRPVVPQLLQLGFRRA
jgi:hypothetical protein